LLLFAQTSVATRLNANTFASLDDADTRAMRRAHAATAYRLTGEPHGFASAAGRQPRSQPRGSLTRQLSIGYAHGDMSAVHHHARHHLCTGHRRAEGT